jgi:hypothetical protein
MPQTLQVVSTVNSWIPPPISEIPSEATRTARMIQSKRNEIVSLLSTPETLSPLYTVYDSSAANQGSFGWCIASASLIL